MNQSLHNTTSLNENYRFRQLYAKGRSCAQKTLVVYALKGRGRAQNRLGITVSKKLGKAVCRNRMRRRLKEAFRLSEHRFLTGFDVVLVVRRASLDAPYPTIERELLHCMKKLGLLREESP